MLIQLSMAISSGELTLASSDINVQPNLDFNYYDDEFDRMRGREAVRKVIELSAHDAFADIVLTAVFADISWNVLEDYRAPVPLNGDGRSAGLGFTLFANQTLHRFFLVLKSSSHNFVSGTYAVTT